MNTWGRIIQLAIFGESHGSAVGITVGGLPAGRKIDFDKVRREMLRRAPGGDEFSTARKEADEVDILSGIQNGYTTGAPICGVIRNKDARSEDYSTVLRPGHADWTARLKFGDYADLRGGGHFSGRLTAPLVFAGALAKQILDEHGISIYGRIVSIGGINDALTVPSEESYKTLSRDSFPVFDTAKKALMREAVLNAKQDGDSVGGVAEAVVFNVPGGFGEPFFGSVESVLSSLLFSIPAVKGVEFGGGFALAGMRGSEANDEIVTDNGVLKSLTNNNGGILGGITNGMPLVVRIVFKPTPSISRQQRTVDYAAMEETNLQTKGRHDPCIVPRAVPVMEAAVALGLLDLSLLAKNL